MLTEEERELAVEFNEALKKVSKGKWKWEPRWGDHFILVNAHCIFHYAEREKVHFLNDAWEDLQSRPLKYFEENSTPLFHGERVVEILEGMGYIVRVREEGGFGEECKYNCGIYTNKLEVGGSAPTFQEAVRQATIELAKKEK